MDIWEDFKFIEDGTNFNYNNKYDSPISVHDMDVEDVKLFKKVYQEIAKELDMILEPYFVKEYNYWIVGMYIDKSYEIEKLKKQKGLIYE